MLMHSILDKRLKLVILKTEQTTIVYAKWDRWASYVIKHMITTDVISDSSKGMEESALLRTVLSSAVSRLSIVFSLKSLLSMVKIK